MLNTRDILETVKMIREENLDIRTVTMGISLFDCISDDPSRLESKIYDKITTSAKNLVKVCEDLERTYGIPIVNKRISVTPISYVGSGLSSDGFVRLAKVLESAASDLGVNFIGGFSAHVQKGAIKGASSLIESIPYAMAETERVCSSINVATTKAGINMDAVKRMGEIIKETAYLTRDRDSIGCAKIVVFSNIPEDNPFMAGAVHGIGEPDTVINVGVSGPGVVAAAIKKVGQCDFSVLAETIKRIAFKITRVGQLIASEAASRLGVPYGIVDLSLAPTPAAGDSVAEILENMGLERTGTHGTTAALALLNDAVKKGGVMATNHVGGLSGAFIPVSEDRGMIEAVDKGVLTLAKLEAMTADERFAFWKKELSKCIRCNACRNVCPACNCTKCVFDNPNSEVSAKANANSFEEQMFHIIRAFHVAGRCTDCGECSRVCPQNIPLHLLNRKFISDIDRLYGEYQAGEDTTSRGPLTNFTKEDAEPDEAVGGNK